MCSLIHIGKKFYLNFIQNNLILLYQQKYL